MQTGVMLISWAEFLLIAFVGGPMFLMDWLRKQRLMEIEHQIVLTDALDREFGGIFAPVVTKPVMGPWEIHIAVPYIESTIMARLFSVVDNVFGGVLGMAPTSYQIFLSAKPELLPGTRVPRSTLSKTRYAGDPVATA